MTILSARHISHAFGSNEVLRDVTVEVGKGELVCLLGPSGCGKTTLLRLVAGLERLQKGEIAIAGDTVAAANLHVPPERRAVGLMFQDFALFPHLTVIENVAFGLKGETQSHERARRMLMTVGMETQADYYPHELSGGQQQRVALARALAPQPRLMLLDEPFSDLDATLRAQVREETVKVLKATGTSTLMVTHDPEEAMGMADRIQVMNRDGRVEQIGPPADLYYHPASAFVAQLFGPANRLDGVVRGGKIETVMGDVEAPGLSDGQKAVVLIRPEAFRLEKGGRDMEVTASRVMGRSTRLTLRPVSGGGAAAVLTASISGPCDCAPGQTVKVALSPEHRFVFPA